MAWEVRVRLKEREVRVVAQTRVAQGRPVEAAEVLWVEEPVAAGALVRVERVEGLVQAEEADKIFSHTPVIA